MADYILPFTSQEIENRLNKVTDIKPITEGGTGANNPQDARNNLELGSVATENIVPIEKGGTGANNVNDVLENFGINPHSWNNSLKVGNFILQYGMTSEITVPANDSVSIDIAYADWNYGNIIPSVIIIPLVDTNFDLVKINLKYITPTKFTAAFVNKYSTSLTFKAVWISIGNRS